MYELTTVSKRAYEGEGGVPYGPIVCCART